MRVTVAVHGRFHGFDLAAQLYRHGVLARLLTTYPRFVARRFLPSDLPLSCAPWLEAARRLWGPLHLPGRSDTLVARSFARFAARHMPPCDIFVGWSAASLEAIAAARAQGAKVVVERGSTHMLHQSRVLAEAHARWNLPWKPTDPCLVERELGEYETADLIAVGSGHAALTFLAQGFPPGRLLVNPYGVDLGRFRAVSGEREAGCRPRLLFVGSVGVRKGVPELLSAFARLSVPAELHLVGPVEEGFAPVLHRLAGEGVVVRGPLPGHALPHEYARADAFVLPSVEEGFGMVILQAMAAGLPVIASRATGLPDADPHGAAGLLVDPGDIGGLGRALEAILGDCALRRDLGAGARRLVEDGWSWQDYGRRAVQAYRKLVPEAALPHEARPHGT